MEKFNLKELGVNYTVLDQDTQETETICVINSDDLRQVIGEYVGTDYTKVGLHIKEILKGFKGFARSPYHITWYTARQENFELSQAIIAARREKNQIVITEILPEIEVDTGFKV
jgi:hypothetical protein